MAHKAAEPRGSRVLTGPDDEKPAKYRLRDAEATSANLLIAIGVAFAAVGLVDLGLLWIPLRVGIPGWEFATVTQTFTNAPMTVFGLTLVTYGLVRHPLRAPAWTRAAAVVFASMAVALAVIGLLYVIAVPAVIQQAGPEAMAPLKRAMVKTGFEIVAYPVIFGVVSVILWRGVTSIGK